MRMLQGVNEQFLFEARHRIVERQRRPAVPRRLEGLGQVSGAQGEIVATLYGELHALGQLSGIARPRYCKRSSCAGVEMRSTVRPKASADA